jgi:endonuclease III
MEAKKVRAVEVLSRLDAHMPDAKIELDYTNPLELLVAVILSAQCTDKRVNMVTPALFARYPTAADYAASSVEELEGYIKTCGLFRSKAKNIIAAARSLVAEFGGRVPMRREQLEGLAGVGKKTAGVVSIHLGGDEAFPVDTHIRRLAVRLGFSRETDPDKVERDLQALVPSSMWTKGHQLLIWHGRRTCFARAPECERCVVNPLCPKIGVKKRTAAPIRAAVAKVKRVGRKSA